MANALEVKVNAALDQIGTAAQLKELRRQNNELSQNCMTLAGEVEKANAIIAAKEAELVELRKVSAAGNRHARRAAAVK